MTPVKIISIGNFTANIFRDDDATAPGYWENTDAFLVYDHRQFTVKAHGFDPDEIFEHYSSKRAPKLYQGYWVFPVFAYIHSGVCLSLSKSIWPFDCPWDTSFKGFCLVTRQKGWTWTEQKARAVAEGVIKEWNQYLSGDVYGYQISNESGDETDSCWGFYGMDHIESEVTSLLTILSKQTLAMTGQSHTQS